jgi:hypothetical protein
MRHRIGHPVEHALLDHVPRLPADLNHATNTAHIADGRPIGGGPLHAWTFAQAVAALRRVPKPSAILASICTAMSFAENMYRALPQR